jgi:hypothetical protein
MEIGILANTCETCNEITKMSRDDMEDGGFPEGYD